MNLRLFALILGLLFSATGQAADPVKVTAENYNKVAIGSNLPFVYQCLGRETSITFHDGTQKTLVWETKNAIVAIQFKNNRVIEKWHSGFNAK